MVPDPCLVRKVECVAKRWVCQSVSQRVYQGSEGIPSSTSNGRQLTASATIRTTATLSFNSVGLSVECRSAYCLLSLSIDVSEERSEESDSAHA